jgi:hypothetical protein
MLFTQTWRDDYICSSTEAHLLQYYLALASYTFLSTPALDRLFIESIYFP